MQWSAESHAGFSEAEPWLPVTQDFAERNVAAMEGEASSMLGLTKDLLALRKTHRPLQTGAYRTIAAKGSLLAFERILGGERVGVFLNLGPEPIEIAVPDEYIGARIVASARAIPIKPVLREKVTVGSNQGVVATSN